MKILFLSLNNDPVSRKPARYGGAGITMRLLAENIENSYIAAEESCFEGDANEKCISIDGETVNKLRTGGLLNHYTFGSNDYDLVVYAEPKIILNTTIPQLCWAVGAEERIDPKIKHLLVHNLKWQKPKIQNSETKIHEFVLGVDIPPFQIHEKEDLVLSCGNQYPQVNSHIIAHWAVRNKIRTIFVGPIDETYRNLFLQNIDYNWATYIGQIDTAEKIKLMKKARVYVDLPSHNINGPRLSVKQSLSYGCSIVSSPMGIMPEVVKNGVNGFIIRDENEFINAVANSRDINQKNCWDTADRWNLEKMISSFLGVIKAAVKN